MGPGYRDDGICINITCVRGVVRWLAGHVLDTIRRALSYRLAVGRPVAVGLIIGAVSSLVDGVQPTTHAEQLQQLRGVGTAVSFLRWFVP